MSRPTLLPAFLAHLRGPLLAAVGVCAFGSAHGVEAEHESTAPKAVALRPEPAKPVIKLPPRPEVPPARDPLEQVRERIAARINASTTNAGSGGSVLRAPARAADATGSPAPTPARAHHAKAAPHWSYEGAGGPQAWARLQPEFAQCATGLRQSPIDIQGGVRVQLDPIAFDYKPGAVRVIDNGHTVQVNVAPGSTLEILGRRYELKQFHFHRPSEERIDGKPFDMVVHLVHKDAEGRLAVVAVLLERGSAQPVVQTVWNNLPLEKGDEVPVRAPLDPSGLLPAERGYYTYMGSLTTPPCSEGVLWMVMKTPQPVSAEQLGIFARLYPMNARPVQAPRGRLIKESN